MTILNVSWGDALLYHAEDLPAPGWVARASDDRDKNGPCKIHGCTRLQGPNGGSLGFCSTHYQNYRRYDHPLGLKVKLREDMQAAIFSWMDTLDGANEAVLTAFRYVAVAYFSGRMHWSAEKTASVEARRAIAAFARAAHRWADCDTSRAADSTFRVLSGQLEEAAYAMARACGQVKASNGYVIEGRRRRTLRVKP